MKRLIKGLRKVEKGITGLETAIILIAFVIVASVFAYVVLSAGLFASQKTKEAVMSGLGSTMSVLQLKGDIIARMDDGVLTQVDLTVGIPSAGSPVDFGSVNGTRMVVVSYADEDLIIPTCNWTLTRLTDVNSDDLLDPNETFQISVDLSSSGVSIGPYKRFTLEVKPPDGPATSFERMIPGRISNYVNLH